MDPTAVLKIIEENPDKWLAIEWDKPRVTGTGTEYYSVNILDVNNKQRLKLRWKPTELHGGVGPEPRQYAPTISIKESSGDFGRVLIKVCDEFLRLANKAKEEGVFKKRKKPEIFDRVQREATDDDGNRFALVDVFSRLKINTRRLENIKRVKKQDGRYEELSIPADKLHEYVKRGAITSGEVDFQVVLSQFGVSLAPEVKCMWVKPPQKQYASLTEEEKDILASDDIPSDDEEKNEDDDTLKELDALAEN